MFLQKHWTWLSESWQKMGKNHIQSVSPRGVSPLGWNQNLPLTCVKFETPKKMISLHPYDWAGITVPNLDSLWRSMKYLNQAQLKQTRVPIYHVFQMFRKRFFGGLLSQVSQHQTPAPCLGRSARWLTPGKSNCSRFGVTGYCGFFGYVWCTTRRLFTQRWYLTCLQKGQR